MAVILSSYYYIKTQHNIVIIITIINLHILVVKLVFLCWFGLDHYVIISVCVSWLWLICLYMEVSRLKTKFTFNVSLIVQNQLLCCIWTKYLKNQPCDVIKMREMWGEVGKTPKKEIDNPSFLWRHKAVFSFIGPSVTGNYNKGCRINILGYYDRGKIVVNLYCYFSCHLLVGPFIQ